MTDTKKQEFSEGGYKEPPNAPEAERAVMGALLVSEEAVNKVTPELKAEDFYSETHRVIYRAILELAKRDIPVDHVTVSDALREANEFDKVGGKAYVFRLVEGMPTAANVKEYVRIIKNCATARAALDVGSWLEYRMSDYSEESPDGDVIKARDKLDDIMRGDSASHVGSLEGSVQSMIKRLRQRVEQKGMLGLRSGMANVDEKLGGYVKGRFYLFAANTGFGKTEKMGQAALYFAEEEGKTVLYQSPEMYRDDMLERMACGSSGINLRALESGRISSRALKLIETRGEEIAQLPLRIDDAGEQTIGRIRRNCVRYRPDVVIVDYIQILLADNPKASRNEQVTQLSAGLNAIKKDFGCVVIAGSQLNRGGEARQDKTPILSDLRDSGSLAQDADVVEFIHRPGKYSKSYPLHQVQIICAKNRHGRVFRTNLWEHNDVLWLRDDPPLDEREVF